MDITHMIYSGKKKFPYKSLKPEFKVTWLEIAVCVKCTFDGFLYSCVDFFIQKLF